MRIGGECISECRKYSGWVTRREAAEKLVCARSVKERLQHVVGGNRSRIMQVPDASPNELRWEGMRGLKLAKNEQFGHLRDHGLEASASKPRGLKLRLALGPRDRR
jgi:hypothetical protein